jgi:ribonuclease HII
VSAVAAISAAEIDRNGAGPSQHRALGRALEAVAVTGSVNLVDWVGLELDDVPSRAVEGGDGKSAAIVAASIVAKVTRDRLMDQSDKQYPGYGFAAHKGYGTPEHAKGISMLGLSPVHRRSVRRKAHAKAA